MKKIKLAKIVNKKLNHLRKKCGFKNDDLTEIKKMYLGEFFNSNDKAYLKLMEKSKQLCEKYNHIGENLGEKPSIFKLFKNYLQKQKIIKILFPIKKMLSSVGQNLEVFIGQVDFLGCGYMNYGCHFSKSCLVRCGNYTMFGNSVLLGDEECEQKKDKIQLGQIEIGSNSWVCSGVRIKNNVFVGSHTVIGCGAIVENNISSFKVAVGRPASEIKNVPKKFKITSEKANLALNERQQEVIALVRKLGIKGNLKEFKKAMLGVKFNSINLALGKIFIMSHRLSLEYGAKQTTDERKKQILDILFYKHGKNFVVGDNLYVDLLGLIRVGDNVTIGNGLCVAGNVTIGSNVSIGNNVSMFATGHGTHFNERKVGFSLKYGIYEFSKSDDITVNDNVKIGNNVVVAPKATVIQNVKDNSLCVKDKIFN